jgi:hypothetical protein
MKIPQIIRNVKMFNQKTLDRQNISGISHPRGIGFALVKSASLLFCEELNGAGPREIRATEISSRLNRRRINKRAHLTGQVGQAETAEKKQNKIPSDSFPRERGKIALFKGGENISLRLYEGGRGGLCNSVELLLL